MKHKKIFFIGFITVFIAIILIVVFAIINSKMHHEKNIDLYFLNPVSNTLTPETRKITVGNEDSMIKSAMDELKIGPKNTTILVNAIPEEVKIEKCHFVKDNKNGDTVFVDLSESYNDLKESQEILLRGAIVWSLTDFDFVENVVLTVNEEPVKISDNKVLGLLNRENVVVNPVISPDKTEIKEVTLYFSDETSSGLCPEKINVEVIQSQTIENQIVEQLIAGPKDGSHYSTIPPETKIRNIKTEESICYVDLSSEFVTKHNGGSSSEMLTIYSIVDSLTELDNVTKVQFLIEGQKEDSFKGHLDFSKPFARNEDIIIK